MTTYATCSLCCESFPTDDLIEYEGRLLCRCCYDEQTSADHAIHEYYYKPSPIFFGEGLRYFGVELEVDAGGDREPYAKPVAVPVSGRIPLATVDCRGEGQAYGQ